MAVPEEPRPLVDDLVAIPDGDSVLRVIQPEFQSLDGAFQSNAFQDQSAIVAQSFGLAEPCASVSVRSLWEDAGGRVEDLVSAFPEGSGVAELRVADLRVLKTLGGEPVPQGVMLDPRPNQPWHAVMFSQHSRPRSKSVRRARAQLATWFWRP